MGIWDDGRIWQGITITTIKKTADLGTNILSSVWRNIDLITFSSSEQSAGVAFKGTQVKTTITESFTGLWGLNIQGD